MANECVKILRTKIEGNNYLGSAVKFTVILNIDTATTAKITIDDPSEIEQVTSVDMTKEADGVYSYIYQSASTDDDGEYFATITITYDSHTAVDQQYFALEEQE
jgi:hypothetical protein